MTSVVLKAPVVVRPVEAFRRACRYEWRHLTELRSTWILLGVVAFLSLLTGITVLLDLRGQNTVSSATVADTIAWTPLATQIPALCFFVLVLGTGPVSTDLLSGAGRTTWLTVNGRRTAYAAKCAVGFTVGSGVAAISALMGALSCAVTLAVAGAPSRHGQRSSRLPHGSSGGWGAGRCSAWPWSQCCEAVSPLSCSWSCGHFSVSASPAHCSDTSRGWRA